MRLVAPMLACLVLGNMAALAQTGASPSAASPSGAPKSAAKSPDTTAGKNAVNEEYADCMRLWDSGTHMTRQEWSRTCRRVQSRLEQVQIK